MTLPADELAPLDEWIAKQDAKPSRPNTPYIAVCTSSAVREAFALFEHVPGTRRVKSLVGTYRSWPAVKRGIELYNDRELARRKRAATTAR
jgi:hypothetical protein